MPTELGNRPGRTALRIVGSVAVALSLLGFWYHATVLRVDFSGRDNPPHFFRAWYVMAGISMLLLAAALVVGIQLIRGRANWIVPFVAVETLILIASFAPGMLWLHPRWGMSIAAASGISGGSVFHVITLFVLWGPITAIIVRRRMLRAEREEVV